MSAVSGDPGALAELSWRTWGQAEAHGSMRTALRRSLEIAPSAGAMSTVVAAETASVERDIGELARSLEDLAAFVRDVAEALTAADATLAAVNDGWLGSGTSPWTPFASGSGAARTWTKGRGARRTITGTAAGPLAAAARSRSVTVGGGSVQDRWTAKPVVSVIDVARSSQVLGNGGTVRLGSPNAHVDLHAHAGVLVAAEATAGVSNREAHVTVGGRLEFGAAASASAALGNAAFGVGASARVFVGASLDGEATVRVGLDGVEAQFEGRALFGGEAEIEGELSVLGVATRPSASVMYGFGAEFKAEADLGLEKIGFAVDLGATLGLGVSVGLDVSVNPRAVAGGVADAVGGGADAAKQGFKKVKGLFS